MPVISIIVPVYKAEKYIHRCVNSILAQTFVDFELILVNDGSPDNCGLICNEYANKDSRIIVIHKKNGGPAEARNVALDIAKGEFIGFVDSDDYIASDMYEKLLDASVSNQANISMCGRYDVFANEIKPSFSFNGNEIWESKKAIENLLTWNNIDSAPCDKLFKKNLFDQVKFPVGRFCEDIFVLPQLLFNAKKIVHIGESKYFYFHRSDSRSVNILYEKQINDLLDAFQTVLDFILNKYPDLRFKAENFCNQGLILLLNNFQNDIIRKENQKSYKIVRRLFFRNIISIFLNSNIDIGQKIKILFIATNPRINKVLRNFKRKIIYKLERSR